MSDDRETGVVVQKDAGSVVQKDAGVVFQKDAGFVGRAMFEAFRARRRDEAEALMAPEFHFTSPYDDAIDRAAFFARCWPNGDRIRGLEIERIAPDVDGAFITYLCTAHDGTAFRNTEYLRVRNGQVISADVYFGASYRDGAFVAKPEA
jgi:hypothetical protein